MSIDSDAFFDLLMASIWTDCKKQPEFMPFAGS
jgi:hypothetical protein